MNVLKYLRQSGIRVPFSSRVPSYPVNFSLQIPVGARFKSYKTIEDTVRAQIAQENKKDSNDVFKQPVLDKVAQDLFFTEIIRISLINGRNIMGSTRANVQTAIYNHVSF